MNYVLKDLIGQIVDTIQQDTLFKDVRVARHTGEVNPLLFTNPTYWEGLTQKIPFVLVRYISRIGSTDSSGSAWLHEIKFGIYVATVSLKSKDEAVEEAETYLAKIFDLLHGAVFYSQQSWAAGTKILSGVQITTSGFCQNQNLFEAQGEDEKLIMALPEITLFESRYTASVWAS